MDQDARDHKAAVRSGVLAPATYGCGRAVRLDPDLYAADVPIHLTICAETGHPFVNDEVARMVCQSVETSAAMLSQRLLAYCLMPDHLHIVLSPADSQTQVSEFLGKFKSFTTNRYGKTTGGLRLWQYSARDRVIRKGENLATVVEYVANNPVRRGLVRYWSDWPYTKVFIDL